MRQPSTCCGKATISAPGEAAVIGSLFPFVRVISFNRLVPWFVVSLIIGLSRSSVCSVESEFKSMTLSHLVNALEHAATMLCSEKNHKQIQTICPNL